jgi:transcription termination/antitermination protein NusA
VLVRDDQLSLAIGRRGQNVRLASKLVGWDIEIMTAEELDEVIEKAVKAFEKIETVDTELAERLVEQGILSFDDLSVMEITDLVNTIDGLTEEQAMEIVAKAEELAEAQTEELPRRKGARAVAEEQPSAEPSPEEFEAEAAPESEGEPVEAGDLSQEYGELTDAAAAELDSVSPTEATDAASGELPMDESPESEHDEADDEEFHDLALAAETSGFTPHGHEVTSPPSESDQGEGIRIVTDAVEQWEEGGTPAPPAAAVPGPSQPSRPAGAPATPSRSKRDSEGNEDRADTES